jgi:RNA polymerase sigma-70 factor (ECF subfamily)
VLLGQDEVRRTLAAIDRLVRGHHGTLIRYAYVNGLPGFVTREADGVLQTTALLIDGGRIRAIYVMRNPDKLRHLEDTIH